MTFIIDNHHYYYVRKYKFLNITYYLLGDIMNFWQKNKVWLIFLGLIFIPSLFVTFLLYLNLLNIKIIQYINLFIMVMTLFYAGYVSGKKAEKKGFLAGLRIGLMIIIIFFIISFFFINITSYFYTLIYYLILLFSAILGATIGINKKNKD